MEGRSLKEKTSRKRSEGTYELPAITEEMLCSVCQKPGITLSRTIYNLPDGDEILILLLNCEACGYKKTDTIPMYNAFEPGIYTLSVDDHDFTHKIFRGAQGNLDIPEVGVSIERGPAAEYDFTNVEGILLKMKTQVEFFLKTNPTDCKEWENANEVFKRLKNCLSGKMKFTVILDDPEGGSYISPSNPNKMSFKPYPSAENQK